MLHHRRERPGQSCATMWQHDLDQFARRWSAFGWHTITVNGHDINAVLDAFAEARGHARASPR